jgi:hypothetical protein
VVQNVRLITFVRNPDEVRVACVSGVDGAALLRANQWSESRQERLNENGNDDNRRAFGSRGV